LSSTSFSNTPSTSVTTFKPSADILIALVLTLAFGIVYLALGAPLVAISQTLFLSLAHYPQGTRDYLNAYADTIGSRYVEEVHELQQKRASLESERHRNGMSDLETEEERMEMSSAGALRHSEVNNSRMAPFRSLPGSSSSSASMPTSSL
jgi:hypothetical protein